jgi:hypothetical protein
MGVAMSFRVQTVSGAPVTRGGLTVTPQAQVISLRLPVGGFAWNRPVAVLVEQGGEIRRLRIVDTTRLLQLGIAGLGLAFAMLIRRSGLREDRRHE